jgi:hypothetical protein
VHGSYVGQKLTFEWDDFNTRHIPLRGVTRRNSKMRSVTGWEDIDKVPGKDRIAVCQNKQQTIFVGYQIRQVVPPGIVERTQQLTMRAPVS